MNVNKTPIESKKRKRKPKGEKVAVTKDEKKLPPDESKAPEKRRKRKSNPLNGLILAISTSENKEKGSKDSAQLTYKEACALSEELGASTTAQVHKRVFAVICNKSAVMQATQRVRKAVKQYTMIVDVEWLLKCKEEGQRVDHEEYLLTELAKEVVKGKKTNIEQNTVDVKDESDEEIMNADAGWSEPVSVGCCCVCHDDDRDDCKWCCVEGGECNVILQKLGKTA